MGVGAQHSWYAVMVRRRCGGSLCLLGRSQEALELRGVALRVARLRFMCAQCARAGPVPSHPGSRHWRQGRPAAYTHSAPAPPGRRLGKAKRLAEMDPAMTGAK